MRAKPTREEFFAALKAAGIDRNTIRHPTPEHFEALIKALKLSREDVVRIGLAHWMAIAAATQPPGAA